MVLQFLVRELVNGAVFANETVALPIDLLKPLKLEALQQLNRFRPILFQVISESQQLAHLT